MMTEKEHLECEIQELVIEMEQKAKEIGKLKTILEQKEQQLKQMNYAEKRKERIINDNWKVETMNANYPMLEVIDENTVKIEGVEYKKVEKPKPQTLYDTLSNSLDGMIIGNFDNRLKDTICTIVSNWLPDELEHKLFDSYSSGWNDCLNRMRLTLK